MKIIKFYVILVIGLISCKSPTNNINSEELRDKIIQFEIVENEVNPLFNMESYENQIWIYFHTDTSCLISNLIWDNSEGSINMDLFRYYELGEWKITHKRLNIQSKNLKFDFVSDEKNTLSLINLGSKENQSIEIQENGKIKGVEKITFVNSKYNLIGKWEDRFEEGKEMETSEIGKKYQVAHNFAMKIDTNTINFSGYDIEEECFITILDSGQIWRLRLGSEDSLFRIENQILRKEYSINHNNLVDNYLRKMN